DLVLAVGTRMGEATTEGYTLIESPVPRQQLIHVYPDPCELGRVFAPTQSIVADPANFAAAVVELRPGHRVSRSALVVQAHQDYLDSTQPLPSPGPMSLDEAAAEVNAAIPEDACITVGAGNYALYPHRYRRFTGPGTSLAPTVGSMGYGLPAAISAKLENPERTVVCYAGDGCFQMNMQELGVALQYRLGIVVLVFNNGMWGTIRAHQERDFPARTIALTFQNPDFTQIIRGYGGYGEAVDRSADFAPALERALAFARDESLPALLEIRYDADGIAPGETLTAIRQAALARQAAH
ncbi:thiamine pyrophosphate-dependent enzyme, partial [Bordetella avium]